MAALMVIPVVWGNIVEQYKAVDVKLIEMSRAYRFTKMKKFWYIYVPSILPAFKAACLTSMGLSWKSGIAAEVLTQPSLAIGSNLYYSKVYLETPELFAWTIVVIILSFLIEKVIKKVINSFQGGYSYESK
jgi:NitT/TauT family transport system permease protein